MVFFGESIFPGVLGINVEESVFVVVFVVVNYVELSPEPYQDLSSSRECF